MINECLSICFIIETEIYNNVLVIRKMNKRIVILKFKKQ